MQWSDLHVAESAYTIKLEEGSPECFSLLEVLIYIPFNLLTGKQLAMTDKIALGSDDAGLPLKEIIRTFLDERNIPYEDYTPSFFEEVDYPDVALEVAHAIARGTHRRGILICGTGIGMAIAANKVHGVYAALAHDTYSAERARKSNNAQVLTMGARVVGPELAKSIVLTWLNAEFSGGPSAQKVAKIERIEAIEQTGSW